MSLTSSDQAFEWDGYILLVFQRRFSRLEAVVRQLFCSTGYVPIIRAHFHSETRDDPLMYRARFDPLHEAASAVDIYYQSLNASPPVSVRPAPISKLPNARCRAQTKKACIPSGRPVVFESSFLGFCVSACWRANPNSFDTTCHNKN